MSSTIFVAGVGAISAIGNNVAECITALETEAAGIENIQHINTIHKNKLTVAEVKLTNE